MARLTEVELETILREVVANFDGKSDDFNVFLIFDLLRHTYAVNAVRSVPSKERGFILMQARVVDDHIVIDADALWDKNLWQALVKAGVPREQIILAYKGEQVPTLSE
ncbi:MAG: XisI protein [Chitinophagaceae bacterium]|nr:XisI protein [Anaerolineae bacterium]